MKLSLILLISLKIIICSEIISIPFRLEFKKSSYYNYNASHFLNEYYTKELFLEFRMGTPFQKVTSYINPSSSCFQFKPYKAEAIYYYYFASQSSSLKINKNSNILSNLYLAEDTFNFLEKKNYTISFEFLEQLNISLDKNTSLIGNIGIKPPVPFLNACPNLFDNLKNIDAIDKKMFSIKYNDKYSGYFVIGNDLYKIFDKKFKEEQLHTNYFTDDFYFRYDNIIIKYPFNKTVYLNISESKTNKKEAIINLKSGFIIGTEDYKNYIHEKFFKYLVEKKICKIDLVKHNETNELLDNEFYLYNCYHIQFIGQASQRHPSINHYEEFPNLVINSKSLELNFELTNKDLFEQIYSRDYFLIIFPKTIKNVKTKNTWYLGEPFYKKYPFTINLDAKTIGFYSNEIINKTKNNINNDINNKDNTKENKEINANKNNNNSNVKNILIKIGEIIVVIILLIAAYFIGIKVKEGRKKRANELKDDCYEYISDNKKDINDSDNDKDNKNKQIVELNSKLGL